MKTIIIDDKQGHKRTIRTLLAKHFPDVEVVAEASNVQEGIEAINGHSLQLLFLDVELPDGTGFDILEKVSPVDFKIIFTTGYEKYAIRAFKFSAIDYLLKPIVAEDFRVAVKKAQEEIKNEILQLKVGTLLSNLQEVSDTLKKVVLKDADNIHIVQVKDILYLEADSNYTKFHLANNQQLLTSNTMKEYEGLLTKAGFFRCHKSFIINLSAVVRLEKKEGGTIILQDGSLIPLAYRKKEEFLEILNMM